MIQLGQDAALGLEGLRRRAGQVCMDQLDGDHLLKPAIITLAAPDVAHAAIADPLNQAEWANARGWLRKRRAGAARDLGRHRRARSMGEFELC